MKPAPSFRLLFAFALITLGLFAGAAPAQSNSAGAPGRANQTSVTVAFWNIEWFPGRKPNASPMDESQQVTAVHSDVAKLKADIIGFEEVRDFTKAGVAVKPLPGFKVDVCANFPPREGQKETQQVAITSRLPASSAWAEEWKPAGAVTPPRGFAFAAYEVAPRQLVLVYAVHLKSNRGDINEDIPIRQESAHQLHSHIEAMQAAYQKLGHIAWVVGGDFNTSLDDNKFAAETTLRSLMEKGFSWCWQNTSASSRMTLPPNHGFPAASFDHIFYRGATLRQASVINTSPLSSDHHAIVATFDLAGAK